MGERRCQSFFGHKFEPRFNTLTVDREEENDGSSITHVWRVRSQRTYCGDVCVRCGNTVNNPPQAHSDLSTNPGEKP